jgi:hypothetical protein
MKRRLLQACWILSFWIVPATADAQRPELRVMPRAGVMTPADWFYVEFKQFGVQPMEWTESAILRSYVVGLGVEAALPQFGIAVRAEAVRTLGAEVAVTHAVLIPASEAHPATVIRTHYRVPTRIATATVDVILPLRLRFTSHVQPYVMAGLGGKHYRFDNTAIEPYEDRIVLPRPGTVPALNAGGGATIRAARIQLDLQVRDAMSRYWDLLQHDVMFLASMSVRLH